MSLAPSPTARQCASGTPAAISSARLVPLSTTGRATAPVRRPSAIEQRVGDDAVEAELGPDRTGEGGEAARHEDRPRAARAHRRDQSRRPRHQPHPLAAALVEHRDGHPREQRDAGIERGGEIELAAHRRLGDRGDLGLQPGIVGELVDALALDQRRIHVGDQQRLAPGRGIGLHDDIDGRQRPLQRGPRRRAGRAR